MEKQQRLTRSQVIARLREHAAKRGYASTASLGEHDKIVLRSIPLHFAGIAAARHVAGVPAPPYQKPARKTGPKPGTPTHVHRTEWSRERVIVELRRLHRAGRSTTWQDLLNAGHAALIGAAHLYLGGLQRARKAAAIRQPKRRIATKHTWTKELIVPAIRARRREGLPLAATRVQQSLYAAARRHYGAWTSALAAAGVDAKAVRLTRKKYTKDVIIERLRGAARDGNDLRSTSLAKLLDLKAVGREFGTLEAAIRAAGLIDRLRQRRHGGAKWDRERVIEELQERAARGMHTFTPGLRRVVQIYLGGAYEARVAAGVPDPVELRIEQRRLARQDRDRRRGTNRAENTNTRAQHVRSREQVIETLRERAARGVHTLTPGLYHAARIYFGGAHDARAAAGVPDPIDLRREQRRRAAAAFEVRHRRRRRAPPG